MNKLPWFTHDHDARIDEFIQRAEDRFGPFGYAAYFKILEIIHQHGVGGILKMERSRLCQNLRARWPGVRLYLNFCQGSGKLQFNLSGTQVELQNKKFIERQSKLKSKTPAKLLKNYHKTPSTHHKKEIYSFRRGGTPPPPGKNGYQGRPETNYCVTCGMLHPWTPKCPPELLK